MRPCSVAYVLLFAVGFNSLPTLSQEFDEQFDAWPADLKIAGKVIACPKVPSPAEIRELIGDNLTDMTIVADQALQHELNSTTAELFPNAAGTEDSQAAEAGLEVVLLSKLKFSPELQSKLIAKRDSGGTVCVFGKVAKLTGKCFTLGGSQPRLGRGMGLLPDVAIQFSAKQDTLSRRLHSIIVSQAPCVGLTLGPKSCVLLDGRKITVAGGNASFSLPGSSWHTTKTRLIVPQSSRAQDPYEWLLDLTQWRRQAMERDLPQFPPAVPPTPAVENGTLFIVGGGGLPENLMSEFVEAAGGSDAKLIYVPCAEQDEVSMRQSIVEMWKKMGVEDATFIHTKSRNTANEDPEFLHPLKEATGIWFGGGRQWNFADSYYGTNAHRLMKEVLQRGGAVGGSSAGASIQARYLARATPIQNFKLMADGYERGGLGFIGGVAIDQHFSQRGRQKDMTELVDRYPQLLGIGIDEKTAIIVRKSVANVVGTGRVHFYDRNLPVLPNEDDFIALPAGSSYDLANRQIIEQKELPASK